jgi:putative ABC transport system permease protein
LSHEDHAQQVLAQASHLLLSASDAARYAASDAPARTAQTFTSRLVVRGPHGLDDNGARFCNATLFGMFSLPFRFGGAWDARADRALDRVVVLDDASNRRLFDNANSVGRTLDIDGQAYRVVGVLAPLSHRLRAYDFSFSIAPALYLPFGLYAPLAARPDYVARREAHGASLAQLLASDDEWIQLWVELPNAERRARYERYLAAISHGRTPPILRSSADFISASVLLPNAYTIFEFFAFVALLACSINLSRLLIVKFQGRAPELAVHRAFGAERRAVFGQHVMQALLVAVAAAALSLLLSFVCLLAINRIVPDRPSDFALDAAGVAVALISGLGLGLLAGLLPAWRACLAPPATFLRVQ